MRSNTLLLILFFFLTSLPISGQQTSLWKLGSLQLPNSDKMNGYIWMPATIDSTSYLYFRKDLHDYPLKYDADEIVAFELTTEKKKFISVMLPVYDTTMRRLAELHFNGEYKLFSVVIGKDLVFFLIDGLGNITRLVNTYDLPGPDNKFSILYNFEYRYELAQLFHEYPELIDQINTLVYSAKSISNLLEQYHMLKGSQFEVYPLPTKVGSVGASAGFAMMRNANPADVSKASYSPMVSMTLSGELASISRPLFLQAGIAYSRGRFYHDTSNDTNNDYMVYSEVTTSVSLATFSFNAGIKIFEKANFTPFVSAGGEYNLYLSYFSDLTEEVLVYNTNVVNTYKSEVVDFPDSFPGVVLELGTNYRYNPRVNLRFGLSYHQYFDKSSLMKNSLVFSLSCFLLEL